MKIRRRKFQSNHAFGHMLAIAFVKTNKTCYAKSTPYFLSLTLVIPRNPLMILFKVTVNEFSTLYGVVKPDVSQKFCGSNIFHISIFVCTFCIIYTECACRFWHFLKAVLGGIVASSLKMCNTLYRCTVILLRMSKIFFPKKKPGSNTFFFDCLCILSWEKHRSSELEEKLQLDSKS